MGTNRRINQRQVLRVEGILMSTQRERFITPPWQRGIAYRRAAPNLRRRPP